MVILYKDFIYFVTVVYILFSIYKKLPTYIYNFFDNILLFVYIYNLIIYLKLYMY